VKNLSSNNQSPFLSLNIDLFFGKISSKWDKIKWSDSHKRKKEFKRKFAKLNSLKMCNCLLVHSNDDECHKSGKCLKLEFAKWYGWGSLLKVQSM
jgi:hypothetical protein